MLGHMLAMAMDQAAEREDARMEHKLRLLRLENEAKRARIAQLEEEVEMLKKVLEVK